MSDSLEQINLLLRQGLIATKQGSYHRRVPAAKAVPLLQQALREVKSWMGQHGESERSLRLLALAEEALLDYDSAVSTLEKMIKLSARPNRNDLKRLAACREAGQLWRRLALTPEELAALGTYLKNKLLDSAPDTSLRWTGTWLSENKPKEKSEILASFRRQGHSSDYRVLHNVVSG
jgi:hypothetical protein